MCQKPHPWAGPKYCVNLPLLTPRTGGGGEWGLTLIGALDEAVSTGMGFSFADGSPEGPAREELEQEALKDRLDRLLNALILGILSKKAQRRHTKDK